MDLCNQSCFYIQPSCVAETVTLDMKWKLLKNFFFILSTLSSTVDVYTTFSGLDFV